MSTRSSSLDALLCESDRQRLLASRPQEQKRRKRLFQAFEDLNKAADWWDCSSPTALRTLAGLVKGLAGVLFEDGWGRFLDRLPAGPGDKERTIAFIKEARRASIRQIESRLQRFTDGSKGVIRIRDWLERLYDEILAASAQSAPELNETQVALLKYIESVRMKGEVLAQRLELSYEHVRHVLGDLGKRGLVVKDERGYLQTDPGRYALQCAST